MEKSLLRTECNGGFGEGMVGGRQVQSYKVEDRGLRGKDTISVMARTRVERCELKGCKVWGRGCISTMVATKCKLPCVRRVRKKKMRACCVRHAGKSKTRRVEWADGLGGCW